MLAPTTISKSVTLLAFNNSIGNGIESGPRWNSKRFVDRYQKIGVLRSSSFERSRCRIMGYGVVTCTTINPVTTTSGGSKRSGDAIRANVFGPPASL